MMLINPTNDSMTVPGRRLLSPGCGRGRSRVCRRCVSTSTHVGMHASVHVKWCETHHRHGAIMITITVSSKHCHSKSFGCVVTYKEKTMLGEMKPQEIEKLVRQQVIARLGCYAEGQVYVVPVSYAYDGDYFYFISRDGKKVEMMRKNPNVCLQIDNMQNMSSWQSVVLWGEFEELTDPKERNHALRELMTRITPIISSEIFRITPDWPFPEDEPENIPGIVYRIRITEVSGRFETYTASEAYDYFA